MQPSRHDQEGRDEHPLLTMRIDKARLAHVFVGSTLGKTVNMNGAVTSRTNMAGLNCKHCGKRLREEDEDEDEEVSAEVRVSKRGGTGISETCTGDWNCTQKLNRGSRWRQWNTGKATRLRAPCALFLLSAACCHSSSGESLNPPRPLLAWLLLPNCVLFASPT